jgi:glycosyltransferase involved in cell wall biosynthesis
LTRLLLFVTRFPPEFVGTAQYALLLANGLARRADLAVTVLAPAYAGRDWPDEALPFSVRRNPALVSRPVVCRYPRSTRALVQALAEVRPDVLWAVNGMATRVAGRVARQLAVPVLGTLHGTDMARRLPGRNPWTWLESRWQRRFYQRAGLLLTNSTFTHDLAVSKGIATDKLRVVRLGVPLPAAAEAVRRRARLAHPEWCDRPLVLTVGRLVPQKGHRLLLDAMAAVLPARPEVRHVIVGDGPERPALAAQIARLGLASQVQLVGRVPPEALDELYSLATVFALTSHQVAGQVEGMGYVFLEAAAWGVPAVATRHGGIPEAVLDGVTGALVPAHAPAVAAALTHLLDNPARRQEMAAAAQARVRGEMSLERMIEAAAAAIDQVKGGA